MSKRILLIDNDADVTAILRRGLERLGHVVKEENDPAKALETALDFNPELIILDFSMPGLHGGDVAWQIHRSEPLRDVKVIVFSGRTEDHILPKLPPRRIPILQKPITIDMLVQLLEEGV